MPRPVVAAKVAVAVAVAAVATARLALLAMAPVALAAAARPGRRRVAPPGSAVRWVAEAPQGVELRAAAREGRQPAPLAVGLQPVAVWAAPRRQVAVEPRVAVRPGRRRQVPPVAVERPLVVRPVPRRRAAGAALAPAATAVMAMMALRHLARGPRAAVLPQRRRLRYP